MSNMGPSLVQKLPDTVCCSGAEHAPGGTHSSGPQNHPLEMRLHGAALALRADGSLGSVRVQNSWEREAAWGLNAADKALGARVNVAHSRNKPSRQSRGLCAGTCPLCAGELPARV